MLLLLRAPPAVALPARPRDEEPSKKSIDPRAGMTMTHAQTPPTYVGSPGGIGGAAGEPFYGPSQSVPTSPTEHGFIASHPDNGYWGSIERAKMLSRPGEEPPPRIPNPEDEAKFPGRLRPPWWWESRPWWLRELPWWLAKPHTKMLGNLDTGQPTGVLGGGPGSGARDDELGLQIAAARAHEKPPLAAEIKPPHLEPLPKAPERKRRALIPDKPIGKPAAEQVEEARPFGHVGDTPPPAIVGVD